MIETLNGLIETSLRVFYAAINSEMHKHAGKFSNGINVRPA